MVHIDWVRAHAFVLATFLMLSSFVPGFGIWPLYLLMPLLGYAITVALTPHLRFTFRRWRFGKVTRATVAATAVIALGSFVTLVAFQHFAHPDLSKQARVLPVFSPVGLIAAGIGFAVVNALLEEIIFRGILFDSVEFSMGNRWAVILTAGVFGYCHLSGYPPGVMGAVLAGIYGLCLGWLRVFSKGLGLPVIAHVVADATIFIILAGSGTR